MNRTTIGAFDFSQLITRALTGESFEQLPHRRRRELVGRFEHDVSDHLPIWVRLPLPE